MTPFIKKRIEYLIVDTSAFISNAALQEIGNQIITLPEVIEEIKSKRQLRRLVVLPYDLEIKSAYSENVKFVSEFSKKTGDYLSLSATDVKVIALTYQLEKEKNGISHLRDAPIQRPSIEPINTIPENLTNIVGFYIPKKKRLSSNSEDVNEHSEYDSAEDEEFDDARESLIEESVVEGNENTGNKEQMVQILENIEQCNIDDSVVIKKSENRFQKDDSIDENKNEVENSYNNDRGDDDYYSDDDDDDDSEWITPSNLAQAKNRFTDEVIEDFENVKVACLTTDFAMQNVLKQIGLNVVSIDGKLIKELRTFILRCYGCFKTTSIMTKVFCPNCGNKTLKKVAVSLNADGTQHIHINFKKPLTARGKKFSLPLFRGGKHSNNPILYEDQPMPQQRPSRLSRTKNNPLEDDYIAGFSPFVTRDVTSKSAMLGIRPHVEIKQWMKRNPNENRKKKK